MQASRVMLDVLLAVQDSATSEKIDTDAHSPQKEI